MKITSRGRPEQLLKTIAKYIELANNTYDMVWLFTFDADDNACNNIDFTDSIYKIISKNLYVVFGNSQNKIHAINRDVDKFKPHWDILLNISDDQIPIVKGYDDFIRNAMPEDLDASLWYSDGHQNRINTQEIIGRKYYERFNYIYNPIYKSFFADNEASEVGLRLGKLKYYPTCLIRHYHPQWDNSGLIKMDELYNANQKYWNEDTETFKKRKQLNFIL